MFLRECLDDGSIVVSNKEIVCSYDLQLDFWLLQVVLLSQPQNKSVYAAEEHLATLWLEAS